jgi:tetratricopeptide (TPR) repeat protein
VSTGSRDASSSKALGASYVSLSFAQQSASKDYSLPPWSLQASDLYAQQTPTSLGGGGGGGLSALHNSYSASQHSHSQFALHQMTMDGSQLTPIAVSSAKVVRRLLGDASVEYSAEKASQLALSAISQLSQSRHHLAPPHFTPSTDAPGSATSAPSSAGAASMASPSKLLTPSGIHAADVSALSMHIPFQTPGSMPFSPITRSMLDEDDDLYAASLGHAANVSSFSLASQQSKSAHRSQLAQNTSLGFELGLSRIDEASTPGLATSIDASSSALAPLRSQLFGQPTPDDVDRSLHAAMPPLPPSHVAQAPAPFPQTQAGGRRRVSFGPSTRLSFSEAALPSDAHLPPAGSGASSTNKVVTAGGSGGERQPSKLLRSSDPADAARDTVAQARAADGGPAVSQAPSSSGSGRRSGGRVRSSSAHGLYLARRFALEHVVSVLAEANQQLAHYCGLECIRVLQEQLPAPHFASALVCSFLGRAYIDMNEYGAAVVAFKEMMRLEPFRLAGLEFLSSALWHQRKEHELASLAQQVVEIDRLAPETWCVLGNCASLQKEAETALRFFQRATQVDPHFTYAYTLSGHEFVANEDMEKAIAAFRTALCCNVRHYNAWYGLGSIYYRQERYELAEYHFREARAINQRSSVLDCYLAMALNAQGTAAKVREALQILADASQRFEHNPQVRRLPAPTTTTVDHSYSPSWCCSCSCASNAPTS